MNTDGGKQADTSIPTAKLLRGCLILSGLLLGCFPLVALYGHWQYGSMGVASAAVAGAICLGAALIGLFALVAIPGVSGILLAMLLRMAIPMASGIALTAQKGSLAEAGVFGFILVNYGVMLVAETKLSLGFIQQPVSSSTSKAS